MCSGHIRIFIWLRDSRYIALRQLLDGVSVLVLWPYEIPPELDIEMSNFYCATTEHSF